MMKENLEQMDKGKNWVKVVKVNHFSYKVFEKYSKIFIHDFRKVYRKKQNTLTSLTTCLKAKGGDKVVGFSPQDVFSSLPSPPIILNGGIK